MRTRLYLGIASLVIVWMLSPTGAMGQSRVLVREFPQNMTLARYQLERAWYVQLPVLGQREKILRLDLYEGRPSEEAQVRGNAPERESILFASTDRGLLHAISVDTGKLLWSTQSIAEGLIGQVHAPGVTEDSIYVVNSEGVIQLDRSNGRMLKTRPLTSIPTSGIAASDDHLYFGVKGPKFVALFTGEAKGVQLSIWPIAWGYVPHGNVLGQPIILPDRVVFAGEDGYVYAMHTDSNRFFYRFLAHARLSALLGQIGDVIYISAEDASVFCVDATEGAVRWRFFAGYPVTQRPAAFTEEVFLASREGGLQAVDNETGRRKWIAPKATRFLGLMRDRVFALDERHRLLILKRETGEEVGRLPMSEFTLAVANQWNDRLLLSTPDGLVVCLKELGSTSVIAYPQEPPLPPTDAPSPGDADLPKRAVPGFFDDDSDDDDAMPEERMEDEDTDDDF